MAERNYWTVVCLCHKELRSEVTEFICPECGRLISISWPIDTDELPKEEP